MALPHPTLEKWQQQPGDEVDYRPDAARGNKIIHPSVVDAAVLEALRQRVRGFSEGSGGQEGVTAFALGLGLEDCP